MRPYSWRNAILQSTLPATTRHVLLTLSCHVNDAGESCYPSTRRQAEETGLSERAVITHLQKAEALGWLDVKQHGFAGQKWARNEYLPRMPDNKKALNESQRLEAKALNDVQRQGTEPDSPASRKGTEPHDEKALNEVQSSSPESSPEGFFCAGARAHDRAITHAREARPAVQASIELRKRHMRCTPSNPNLLAAIDEGVTPDAIAEMADCYQDKPAGYVIAACRYQRAEKAKPAGGSHENRGKGSARRESVAERAERFAREGDERDRRRHEARSTPKILGAHDRDLRAQVGVGVRRSLRDGGGGIDGGW
jgi:hypothetical protein